MLPGDTYANSAPTAALLVFFPPYLGALFALNGIASPFGFKILGYSPLDARFSYLFSNYFILSGEIYDPVDEVFGSSLVGTREVS